jgi:hypothetical protein
MDRATAGDARNGDILTGDFESRTKGSVLRLAGAFDRSCSGRERAMST